MPEPHKRPQRHPKHKTVYRVKNWRAILVNRLRVQGMIVFDWKDRYGEALKALSGYFAEGRLKYRESVVEGLENAPRGLIAPSPTSASGRSDAPRDHDRHRRPPRAHPRRGLRPVRAPAQPVSARLRGRQHPWCWWM